MVISIKGTLSKDIIEVLMKLGRPYKHLQVKEVTLDMAKNMEAAVTTVFTNAIWVTDRFHVLRLAMEGRCSTSGLAKDGENLIKKKKP